MYILHFIRLKTLYKTQVRELKEEVDERIKQVQALQGDLQLLQEERDLMSRQLELALAKAESEELARSIVEEQFSDLEKERTMLELEVNDLNARHKAELSDKTKMYSQVSQGFQRLFFSILDTRYGRLALVELVRAFYAYPMFLVIIFFNDCQCNGFDHWVPSLDDVLGFQTHFCSIFSTLIIILFQSDERVKVLETNIKNKEDEIKLLEERIDQLKLGKFSLILLSRKTFQLLQ